MSREYPFFNTKSFSIKSLFFLFTFLALFGLFIPTSVQAISSAKKEPCVGNFSTGYKSPFSKTNSQCLGTYDTSGIAYFQFAVELPIASSSSSVTAKNGNNDEIRFVKENDKLYVSEPDSGDKTLGYMGVVGAGGVSCNSNDGINKITITAKASGKTQVFNVNLCENKTTYVIGKTADELTAGDNGTQAPAPQTGCLKGNIGLVRDDTAGPNWTADQRNAKLQQSAVTYLKVSGPTAHEITNSGDIVSASTKEWFTLEDGLLTLKKLAPGRYTVTLKYNDKIKIVEDIGPGADAWTTSEATFTFANKVVDAGSTCNEINNGEEYVLSATTGERAEPATETQAVDESSSCKVEGVGWIVCPITTFLAKISDGALAVISGMLNVNTQLLDRNSGTYTAWAAFRNIANVAFVIAFLVIIYSQLTGKGVSNYGVKKTLPRLIVTVILVNVSFFICQLAVDVTQIIGASIGDFLQSIDVSSSAPAEKKGFTDIMGDILSGIGVAAITGIAVGGGAAAIALAISTPVLLAALLSVLMTVVILIGRQAAIVILIVISPLAFVAYLLPNTESWFKKWYKMFIALLMVYPIIAILFGGGALASAILANVATNSEGLDKLLLSITAIGVAAIPLIMVPSLLKGALNSTGAIGAKLSGFAARANKGVGRAVGNSRLGEARQGIKNQFALRRASRRGSSTRQQTVDNSRIGRALGLDKGAARAVNTVIREDESEVEAAVAQIKMQYGSTERVDEAQRILKDAIKKGNATQARAAQRVLLGSGSVGISKLQDVYSAQGEHADMASVLARTDRATEETMSGLRTDINGAGLKGKNNALAVYGYSGANNSLSSHVTNAATYGALNPVELAGQSPQNLELNQNNIDPAMARAVLANSDAAALLDTRKRKVFEARAALAPADSAGTTPGAAPATGTPAGGTPAAAPATGGSVSQRARQRAEEAARGTAGTTPLSVSSDGTIEIPHNNNGGTPPTTPPAGS